MNPAGAKPSQTALSNFRIKISESFDLAELNELCFDLGIDFENLAGTTKDSKTRELILFFIRRNELSVLIAHLTKTRPRYNWEEIIGFPITQSNSPSETEPVREPIPKLRPINNTFNIINTGGGSIIGGSANAGRDFIGRDKVQSTYNLPQPISTDYYSKLWVQLTDMLIARKWKEADQTTNTIILEISGRQKLGMVQAKDVDKIPCDDLKAIDYLWGEYSNQKFGFSVQRNIWFSVGGQMGKYDFDIFGEFGERVGWRIDNTWLRFYDDFKFSLDAPEGHLPSLRMPGAENQASTWQSWRDCFKDFLLRINVCASQ